MESNVKHNSGMSIAAMILGIFGLVFIWMPFLGFVAAVLGIIFGGISLSQIKKNPEIDGKGMATAGLVCGIIAVAGWIILIATIGILGFFSV